MTSHKLKQKENLSLVTEKFKEHLILSSLVTERLKRKLNLVFNSLL